MVISRFPLYEFTECGFVISNVKKNSRKLKPISMGNYVGLQLLNKDGVQCKEYLHRLICEAKNGPCPDGMECRHIDGDKRNNKASNLEWGTVLENAKDRVLHGTSGKGESNSMAKLSESDVLKMRDLRGLGIYYKDIASMYGVSNMTAHRAINGKCWGHI